MESSLVMRAIIASRVQSHRRKRNPDPRVSASDRALIEAAVTAGRIVRCVTVFVAPTRQAVL
jgi:hypothetical protein